MTRGFIPPSGVHDASCKFVCKSPQGCTREHSCTVCDEKSLNEVLRELGYRSEPAHWGTGLNAGQVRVGRKDVWCGVHRIMEAAHASEVWAWLRVTYDISQDH